MSMLMLSRPLELVVVCESKVETENVETPLFVSATEVMSSEVNSLPPGGNVIRMGGFGVGCGVGCGVGAESAEALGAL
jgi:hypothetical protein